MSDFNKLIADCREAASEPLGDGDANKIILKLLDIVEAQNKEIEWLKKPHAVVDDKHIEPYEHDGMIVVNPIKIKAHDDHS